MPNAFIGNLVQTPMDQTTNGGMDKSPAIIVEVGGTGPNGGILVNIDVFSNNALSLVTHAAGVEFMDYEQDARNLGIGAGAWPLDQPWA